MPDESGAAAVPFPGNNLLLGSEGEDVRLLQTYLSVIRQDYPSITELTPDGIFGAQTEQAVKDYQELFGLNVNGVVGPVVWYSIANTYNNIAGTENRQEGQWAT